MAKDFNLNLKLARVKKQMTLDEVSKKTGISVSTLCSWENDKTSPKVNQVFILAELYEVKIKDFFEFD